MIVDVEGNSINLNNYSLIIDGAILSKTDKYDFIITNQTLNLINGGRVDFPFEDLNGDSQLTFTSVDSWEVFNSNKRNYKLGNGTIDDSYRFIFSQNTTYYLNLYFEEEKLEKSITPENPGETKVELSVTSLLISLVSKTSSKEDLFDYFKLNFKDFFKNLPVRYN